jgi:hypothetical protein
MDEVSARAEMADAVDDSSLAVTVPRSEVERVLATDEEVDLVLDVVRTNGEREERRIFLAWDREALRRLVDQGGERIVVAIDPNSLQEALDVDVEAHGVREMGATLAIAVTALGGASAAGAAVDERGSQSLVTDSPSIEATVDTSGWQGAAEAAGYGARGTPSHVAADTFQQIASRDDGLEGETGWQGAAEAAGYGVRETPGDMTADPTAGIENIRAGQDAPEVASTPSADIETVRAGGSAIPDPDSAIENVRATRTAPEAGDSGGVAIDVPSAGVTAALAGGAALTIAAAAFALRRRREPEPAT